MEAPPSPGSRQRFAGIGLLVAAVAGAAAVSAYLFLGGDDAAAPVDSGDPFEGTPLAKISGVPLAPNTGPLDPQRPEEGKPAPNFALIDVRDGRTIRKLSDFRGKAVVVNWYASWCVPCKAEIPEFQAASLLLADQVIFLGVDPLESRDDAAKILDELGATYPAVMDSSGAVTDHYRVGRGIPKTYFIDKDGILRATKTGQMTREELAGFLLQAGVTYAPR
jgi:thiol-disulfide isomerase/thioredoxin